MHLVIIPVVLRSGVDFSKTENYKHKSLPYGKDLVGEDLRQSLKNVFERHAYHSEKLAPS